MKPSLSIDIQPGSAKEKALLRNLKARYDMSANKMQNKHSAYEMAEDRFVAYMPERDVDARRRALRESGKPQYTTLVLPYSYAILMTAHTYWTSVFLSRSPVFQFQARHGEIRSNEQAVESLFDYQLTVGQWLVPLYIWLLDVGKYGDGIIGAYWCEEKIAIPQIVEQEEMFLGVIPTGKMKKKKITQVVPGYVGNKLFNVRPQHFFPDTRRPLHRFQDGEFAARYVEMSWNELKKGEGQGYYINLEALDKLGKGTSSYLDQFGSAGVLQPDQNTAYLNSTDSAMKDMRGLLEMYVELIPSDWQLGSGKYPEKWVFVTDVRHQIIIMARPLGALHNKFQYANIQLEPDGYSLSSRGMMEILEPLQSTMDWLVNTHFYNVRKALNDQFVVDPSRVVMKDVLDPLPGGVIRMKPGAFGQDARTMISQLQVNDITQLHMQDADRLGAMIQRVSGVNDQIMGMLQQGGRRTAQEVRTSSAFGANRLKTQTEYFSAMGFAPLSQILLANTQQYYDLERQYRIAGDLMQVGAERSMMITPENIAGYYDFIPVDGTMPVDRFAQANLWRELLAQAQTMPQVLAQYDTAGIFAWVAQLSGLKNLNQFRIQLMPDGVAQMAAAQGDLVGLGDAVNAGIGGGGPPSGPTGADADRLGGVAEPGQLSGMGQTA